MPEEKHLPAGHRKSVRVFLCGDVMCGRGIDQVLAHPCSPEIYEHYLRSAEGYVLLAEQANGPFRGATGRPTFGVLHWASWSACSRTRGSSISKRL